MSRLSGHTRLRLGKDAFLPALVLQVGILTEAGDAIGYWRDATIEDLTVDERPALRLPDLATAPRQD